MGEGGQASPRPSSIRIREFLILLVSQLAAPFKDAGPTIALARLALEGFSQPLSTENTDRAHRKTDIHALQEVDKRRQVLAGISLLTFSFHLLPDVITSLLDQKENYGKGLRN